MKQTEVRSERRFHIVQQSSSFSFFNLLMMGSNLLAMASNLIAMVQPNSDDGLQPNSDDGLQPNSDGPTK